MDTLKTDFRKKFDLRVKFEEPLSHYLAYQVGGPADILVFPKNEEELNWIAEKSEKSNTTITVIGTGTNLLVLDGGIRGIVVSLHLAFKEIEETKKNNASSWIRCGGGVSKPHLLEWAIEKGLGGLEFSAGVPGTIGGGIFMNAGTKYGCYGDILKELRIFDFHTGAHTLSRENVHFGYREQTAVKESLVLSAVFELIPKKASDIRHEVDRIIAERAEKQPLNFPSCGSTFKNPEGYSAGRLIEKTGLKGHCVGGAEISLKHANFILNKGNATAQDILTLIDIIKARVFKQSGIQLECEVIVLGESSRETKISN